jgi:hypothetical protein
MLVIKIICGALCVVFALSALGGGTDKNKIILFSVNSLLFALLYVAATMTNIG